MCLALGRYVTAVESGSPFSHVLLERDFYVDAGVDSFVSNFPLEVALMYSFALDRLDPVRGRI